MTDITFNIQFTNLDDEVYHEMIMLHGFDFGSATFLLMHLRDMTSKYGGVQVTQDENMTLKIAPLKKEIIDE